MTTQGLTEYERRRLENMKRNEEMMASLKLRSKALELGQRNKSKANRQKKPKSNTPKLAARSSLRAQGLQPEHYSATITRRQRTKTKSYANSKCQNPIVISPSPRFEGLPSNSSEIRKLDFLTLQETYRGEFSDRLLIDTVASMSDNASLNCLGNELLRKGDCLELGLMVLKPENIARVMPGRIMEVTFFPCNDRTMVVAGNRSGNVVFWDVDCANERNDGIYLYQPHTASISGISVQPFALSKVFSSGYDGIIRMLDFEKDSFNLVYSSDNAIFSLSQQPQDTNSLYIGEGTGLLNLTDTRIKKPSSSWKLHEDKINTIDFHPHNLNLMATSSSDGFACIWDLRQMDLRKAMNLKATDPTRDVLSAYFSPTGSFLATTSFVKNVGIVCEVDLDGTPMVYHNSQDGLGASSFRAIWGWDESYLFIGSMKKEVDVISREGNMSLRSSLMSGVPCRFAAHPYKIGTLAGATRGGEVYVWTQN